MASHNDNNGLVGILTLNNGTFNVHVQPMDESASGSSNGLFSYRRKGEDHLRHIPAGTTGFVRFSGQSVSGQNIGIGSIATSGEGVLTWQVGNGREWAEAVTVRNVFASRKAGTKPAQISGELAISGTITEQASGGSAATASKPTSQTTYEAVEGVDVVVSSDKPYERYTRRFVVENVLASTYSNKDATQADTLYTIAAATKAAYPTYQSVPARYARAFAVNKLTAVVDVTYSHEVREYHYQTYGSTTVTKLTVGVA